jgi:hypothetical protein
MPNPKDFKDEQSFISACIPVAIKEGLTQEQAAGKCYGMWRGKSIKKDSSDMTKSIIELFQSKQVDDSMVHKLAEQLNVDPSILEGEIYKLISTILAGGKSYNSKEKINTEQLKMGIKVEMEHLDNTPFAPYIAKKIASDHLVEIPDYYIRLQEMESKAKLKKSINLIKVYKTKLLIKRILKMAEEYDKDK